MWKKSPALPGSGTAVKSGVCALTKQVRHERLAKRSRRDFMLLWA
jgi:hypothetical protein